MTKKDHNPPTAEHEPPHAGHDDAFYDKKSASGGSILSRGHAAPADEAVDELYDTEAEDFNKKMQDEQDQREEDIMAGGVGAVSNVAPNESPDETKTIMKKDSQGNVIIITTTSPLAQQSSLKACAEYFVLSLKSCFRTQRFTTIYAISLFSSLVMLCILLIRRVEYGVPPTDNADDAYSRIWISVIMCIIISIAAFFILNLSITNLSWGFLWMYAIVSLLYFDLTSLSKAAYIIYTDNYSPDKAKRFANVFDYTMRYMGRTSPSSFPSYFRNIGLYKTCCDFNCTPETLCRDRRHGKTKNFYNKEGKTLWEKLIPKDRYGKFQVPLFCYDQSSKDLTATVSKDTLSPTIKPCTSDILFDQILRDMAISLGCSVVLLILCFLMAFVFWYYYSNLKSAELEETQIPGDYALLYSRLHRPRLHDAIVDRNPKFFLKKEKIRLRLQQMKQRHGGESVDPESGEQNGHGHSHSHHGHSHSTGGGGGEGHPGGRKKKKKKKKLKRGSAVSRMSKASKISKVSKISKISKVSKISKKTLGKKPVLGRGKNKVGPGTGTAATKHRNASYSSKASSKKKFPKRKS